MTKKTKFMLHPFETDPGQPPLYAVIPDDATSGWVVGELSDVQTLADRLNRFLVTKRHDGEIDEFDERLGSTWLDVADAVQFAEAVGLPKAAQTIRKACAAGEIAGARLDGKTWRMARVRLHGWLRSRRPQGRPKSNRVAK